MPSLIQREKEMSSKVVTKKRVTENDRIFGAQMSQRSWRINSVISIKYIITLHLSAFAKYFNNDNSIRFLSIRIMKAFAEFFLPWNQVNI